MIRSLGKEGGHFQITCSGWFWRTSSPHHPNPKHPPLPLEFLVSFCSFLPGEFWERKKQAGGWVQRIPNPHFLLAGGQEFSG